MTNYQICTHCIMDTTASDIFFDDAGVCNYCKEYDTVKKSMVAETSKDQLDILVNQIKTAGRESRYDCIIGVSGGLDSSYVLYTAVQLGLKPLAVHLDNGWNSELAVSNIEKLCRKLEIDLTTRVIDWRVFKELQVAFFKSNVIDIEMLTDHAIVATLYATAHQNKVKYILAGTNTASEGSRLPPEWAHLKIDKTNISAIYKKHGCGKSIDDFPMINLYSYLKLRLINGIKWTSILNYVPYSKVEAEKTLRESTEWKPYEKKHYESIFTRFYQGYILPVKFNVDKRKVHYSCLIRSGQISREDAVRFISEDPYNNEVQLKEDREYVLKKLNFSEEFFETYMRSPPVLHSEFPSDEQKFKTFQKLYFKFLK